MEEIDSYKFYRSTAWLHKRQEVLDEQNYECQMCKQEGGVSKGIVVHHVKHLKDRNDLALTNENLLVLCLHHHNVVHPEKNGGEIKEKFINKERWE